MNKIIYLVTDGSYSDYHILGVYDDKEKAELAKKVYASNNEIEEMALNAILDHPPGLLHWNVNITIDGNASCRHSRPPSEKTHDSYYLDLLGGKGLILLCCIWAENEQAAIKIANERRTIAIATNAWEAAFQEQIRARNEMLNFSARLIPKPPA